MEEEKQMHKLDRSVSLLIKLGVHQMIFKASLYESIILAHKVGLDVIPKQLKKIGFQNRVLSIFGIIAIN